MVLSVSVTMTCVEDVSVLVTGAAVTVLVIKTVLVASERETVEVDGTVTVSTGSVGSGSTAVMQLTSLVKAAEADAAPRSTIHRTDRMLMLLDRRGVGRG